MFERDFSSFFVEMTALFEYPVISSLCPFEKWVATANASFLPYTLNRVQGDVLNELMHGLFFGHAELVSASPLSNYAK